jgi:hypothetical protein
MEQHRFYHVTRVVRRDNVSSASRGGLKFCAHAFGFCVAPLSRRALKVARGEKRSSGKVKFDAPFQTGCCDGFFIVGVGVGSCAVVAVQRDHGRWLIAFPASVGTGGRRQDP